MLPVDLKAEQFSHYPPQASHLAVTNLAMLRQLPLSFLPSLLREWIEYDYKFPAERSAIDKEISTLRALGTPQRAEWFQSFSALQLSSAVELLDWVNQPAQFTEQLSAYLWSTQQMDRFRAAATAYGNRLQLAAPAEPLPTHRLGVAIIGQGVAACNAPLFRLLRQHGTYFDHVQAENGLALLLSAAESRSQAHPVPYGHWYVDGDTQASHSSLLTSISYGALDPARAALLTYIETQVNRPGMGPEELRTHLARLSPAELGMSGDALLDRFQVKLLTEGSGTQIFSTTYAQWAAREVLRRAQALTLVVRFAPRQRQRPMNELLSSNRGPLEVDPAGSLIDADMGAYYHWINQQRLPGSEHSAFIAWFEGHSQALAIGPSLPCGVESHSAVDLAKLVSLASG